MAGTDAQGAAGLKGIVNDHPFQYLKALGLMSVFNIISSEFENTQTDSPYVQTVLADSQSITKTLGSKLIDRAMDVQPTITIKAGVKVNIVANTILSLPPLQPYQVTMPYQR
jgi:type IV secretion system protein VirB10